MRTSKNIILICSLLGQLTFGYSIKDSSLYSSKNGIFVEKLIQYISAKMQSFLSDEKTKKKNALEHLLNIFSSQGFRFIPKGEESFTLSKGNATTYRLSNDSNKKTNLSVLYLFSAKGILCPEALIPQQKNNLPPSPSDLATALESKHCIALFSIGKRASTSHFNSQNKITKTSHGIALKVFAIEASLLNSLTSNQESAWETAEAYLQSAIGAYFNQTDSDNNPQSKTLSNFRELMLFQEVVENDKISPEQFFDDIVFTIKKNCEDRAVSNNYTWRDQDLELIWNQLTKNTPIAPDEKKATLTLLTLGYNVFFSSNILSPFSEDFHLDIKNKLLKNDHNKLFRVSQLAAITLLRDWNKSSNSQ